MEFKYCGMECHILQTVAHQVAWSSFVAEVCGTQSNACPLEAWAGRLLAVNAELAYDSLFTGKS